MDFLYSTFIEPLEYQFMQRALMASVMVGIINGTLGCFLILRRMAFLGDALSHAVLPGVVIAFMLAGKGHISLFFGAVLAGLFTALLIGFVNRNSRIKEDTAIGVIFIGAFALGILLISRLKAVHLDLQHFLFGDPLGVSSGDLIMTFIIGVGVLSSIILFYKQFLLTSFDPTMASAIGINTGVIHYYLMVILSMTIVASLQAVGIILVVAMLITPGATAYLLTDRLPKMLPLAGMIGAFSAILGLYISYWMNYSSGAAMVIVVTLLFLITFSFAPKHGIFIRHIRQKSRRSRHRKEDVIKSIYHLAEKKELPTAISLSLYTGIPHNKIYKTIHNLEKTGMIETKPDKNLTLTEKGKNMALKLIRSHRLWETYLTEKAGLGWENVDEEAERLEHILPEELVDEIDEKLGYPATDPHGAPIPQKDGTIMKKVDYPLTSLNMGDEAIITRVSDQLPEVLSLLWENGLVPNTKIIVTGKNNEGTKIKVDNKEYILQDKMTARIMVRKV